MQIGAHRTPAQNRQSTSVVQKPNARVGLGGNYKVSKFNITGLNTIEQKNLGALWNRGENEKLICEEKVGEDDKLVRELRTMSLWEKTKFALSKTKLMKGTELEKWGKSIQLGVDKTITDLTERLDATDITAKVFDEAQTEAKEAKDSFIHELFTEKLATLNRSFYKRKITDHTFEVLTGKIVADQKPPKDASKQYKAAWKSAKVFAAIGNVSAAGGGSDSLKVWGWTNQLEGAKSGEEGKAVTLGIFKDPAGDPLSASNRKITAKLQYVSMSFFNKISGGRMYQTMFDTASGQSYLAEVASAIAAKHVGIAIEKAITDLQLPKEEADKLREMFRDVVPDTQVEEFSLPRGDVKRGSFQLWANPKEGQGVVESQKYMGTTKTYGRTIWEFLKAPFTKQQVQSLPKEALDVLTINDLITGQSDRHGENILLVTEGEKQNPVNVKFIDGGWAFSPEHPTSQLSPELSKQYIILRLAQADRDFTDFGKKVIDHFADPTNVDAMINDMEKLYRSEQDEMNRRREEAGQPADVDFKYEARLERVRERVNVMVAKKDDNMSSHLKVRTKGKIMKLQPEKTPPPPAAGSGESGLQDAI